MRYWIYWNDLVQGPFELEELNTLKALSEDLPVCLEDRTDWIPACRVADLAPIIEERRSSRMPSSPPPPPPSGRPAADPVQGEFFTEAPNQKWLFPENNSPSKGPFAFAPKQLEMKTVFSEITFTAPIRFSGNSLPNVSTSAVLTPPRPLMLPPEIDEQPDVYTPMTAMTYAPKESAVPQLEEDVPEAAGTERIPLEIYPDTPDPAQPLPALSMEEKPGDRSTLHLAGWMTALFAGLLLLGGLSYKWFDFSTSKAAIRQARKHWHGSKDARASEAKEPVPTTPLSNFENQEQAAVELVKNYVLPRSGQTIGERAAILGEETSGGKKPVWNAEHLTGPTYRVSCVLPAKTPGGSARAYSFVADMAQQTVMAGDGPTDSRFLKPKKKLLHKSAESSRSKTPVAPSAPVTPAPAANAAASVASEDPWKNREQEAKDLVQNKNIPKINQTIGDRAQAMVERAGGQTKGTWDALQIKDSVYRVSLIVTSSQPGAADSVQIYPFLADLKNKTVTTDEKNTVTNFIRAKKKLAHKTNPQEAPIQSASADNTTGAAAVSSRSAAPGAAAGDPWKNREEDAKNMAINKQISKINQTVGERAQAMAELNSTPTKTIWQAVQTKDALYHVTVQIGNRLYPFTVDLKNQKVFSEDAATNAKFLKAKKKLIGKPVAEEAQAQPAAPAAPATVAAAASPSEPAGEATATPTATAVPAVSAPVPAGDKLDPWKDRIKEAIALTTGKKISTTNQTIGDRAAIMLEGMHDKELLYAADNGQRLYLPDKLAWSALRETGPVYRVYLGFSADQASGERIQTQAYQFQANLEHHIVVTDDAATTVDFLEAKTALVHVRDQRAVDLQNILSAVDALNKQLMRAIIVKDNRKNRLEEKNIATEIKAVMQRFQRAVIFFRTTYPDSMLQNIAKAYGFTKLLKDHV